MSNHMKKNFQLGLVLLYSTLFLTACFEPTGKIRVKTDIKNAQLYIDGELKVPIDENFIELELVVNTHKLEVKSLSEDEEWSFYGLEEVKIIENVTVETKIQTRRTETDKRKERLAHEKKEREAVKLAKKVEAKFRARLQEKGVL